MYNYNDYIKDLTTTKKRAQTEPEVFLLTCLTYSFLGLKLRFHGGIIYSLQSNRQVWDLIKCLCENVRVPIRRRVEKQEHNIISVENIYRIFPNRLKCGSTYT